MIALMILANRISVPAPLVLVPAGVLLGFVHWFPHIELNPDLVLLVFLPPLVYTAGAVSSAQDFHRNLRSILLLSVGLVLFTMSIVAAAAHYAIPGMGWPAAFVLGAIVAPTDDVAAASIARRLALPHRIVSLLEGEGLMNDAAALTAFRFGAIAVVKGYFSFSGALLTFLVIVLGETAFGLLVGWTAARIRERLNDPSLEIAVSLVTPFVAYLPPERLGGSGVLAAAVAGLYIGRQLSTRFTSELRLSGMPVWQMLAFVLNHLLFLVTGLQLKLVLHHTSEIPASTLLYYGALISAVVIVTRFIWVYPGAYLSRALSARIRERDPIPPWRHLFVVSWTGMRGAISLAAALGIPVLTEAGSPFPDRNLMIFISFCVILSTLVLQGVTLAPLCRWLGVDLDGARERRRLHHKGAAARIEAARAVLGVIDDWAEGGEFAPETMIHLREEYERQPRRLELHQDERSDQASGQLSRQEALLHLKALSIERSKILALWDEGRISDAELRIIELDLDLQEARLKQNPHVTSEPER